MNIYTVFDQKAAAFLQPFFMNADPMAVRTFSNLVDEPGHQFNKNPEDFALYKLGAFDEETGIITPLDPPILLYQAIQYQQQKES